MRRVIAALSLCIALPAVVHAQDKQVTLLTYGGIFRDNYLAAVITPFTESSKIAVQYGDPGSAGSAQYLGTLRAQKSDPQVDVVIMDATTAAAACAEGLVEKLTAADIPEFAELDGQAIGFGNGCGPAVTYDHLVLTYDTQNVAVAPKSWADLANPAYHGQVSFTTLPNIQALAMIGVLAHSASGDWTKFDAALPVLRAIAANVQTFEPSPDGNSMILSDQVRFASGWNARGQIYHDQSKGRIGVVIPQEGTAFQINTINLVAHAPHRAEAIALIRHALSAGPQAAFTDRMFYGPTNARAQLEAKAISRTALAPENRSKVVPIDWIQAVRLRDAWAQRWRREVMTAATR